MTRNSAAEQTGTLSARPRTTASTAGALLRLLNPRTPLQTACHRGQFVRLSLELPQPCADVSAR